MTDRDDFDVKRCAKCAAWIPTTATKCSYCDTSSPDEPPARPRGPAFSLRHGIHVTDALMVVNLVFFVFSIAIARAKGLPGSYLQWTLTGTGFGGGVLLAGGNFEPWVAKGEWWRLVSANYLHFGLWHLALNMFALRDLGRFIERLFGPSKLLAVWFVSGLGCTTAMWLLSPALARGGPPGIGAGASGAVSGLVGMMLVYYRDPQTSRAVEIRNAMVRSVILVGAIGFALPLGSTVGHVAGGLTGAAFGWFLRDDFAARLRGRPSSAWARVALVCVAVTVVALALAVRFAFTYTGDPR